MSGGYEQMGSSEAYVEDKDTPEDPLNGLGNIPPRTFGLGSGTKNTEARY